jgi:AhpD family alkylhydroperoxidase
MQERMKNPAMLIPEAMPAIQSLAQATYQGGVSPATLALIHLRASQINGCSACVQAGTAQARKAAQPPDPAGGRRLGSVKMGSVKRVEPPKGSEPREDNDL